MQARAWSLWGDPPVPGLPAPPDPTGATGPTGPETNAAVRVFVATAIASTGQCIGLEWAQSHGACPAAVTADTVSTDLTA